MSKPIYDKVSISLLDKGISADAIRTTLPKEGYPTVRTLLSSDKCMPQEGIRERRNIIFSAKQSTMDSTLLLLNLVAKELMLLGNNVEVLPNSALSIWDSYPKLSNMDYILLPGFYLTSNSTAWGSFYDPPTAEIVQRVIMSLYYKHGVGFGVYCDLGIGTAANWWSDQLIHFFKRTSEVLEGH